MHPLVGKHRATGVFASYGLLAVLLAATGSAQAWGPVTHAYIASQVFPNAAPAALFGAMAADMNDFSAWDDALASNFKHLTHFEAGRLSPSPFQLGMLTHNSDWGGDSYAHAYFHVPTDKLYPLRIYEQLSREVGISMNDAEDVIETLMDYVICRDLGPTYIRRIAEAADAAGPAEEQALVDAFTEPLMQKMPEFSRDQAVDAIRLMFQCDKILLKGTAELMSLPDKSLLSSAPLLLAAGSGMDIAKAGRCVQRSIDLCADWRANLDAQSREIATQMRALHLINE